MATTEAEDVRVISREEITLGGKKIELIHENVPIDQVRLDSDNPRIGYIVRSLGTKATQERIRDTLWGTHYVKGLARQIMANGGLIERPILQQVDGHFVAREGNCRATVYYKLNEEDPGNEEWRLLPARVLPESVDSEGLMRLLGDFHIAGKNTWQPYEKAAYITRMLDNLAFDSAELATILRMSKTSLYQHRNAYVWMDEAYLQKYKADEGAERVRDFSHFFEFEKVYKRIEDPPAKLRDEFVDWVGQKKFKMAIQVRELPSILETPGAKDVLAKDGFHAAMELVGEAHPERTSKLFGMVDRATKQLKAATMTDIEDLRAGDRAKVAQIKRLHKALEDLAALANIDLER